MHRGQLCSTLSVISQTHQIADIDWQVSIRTLMRFDFASDVVTLLFPELLYCRRLNTDGFHKSYRVERILRDGIYIETARILRKNTTSFE